MDWEVIAVILEALALIVVVATLFYLTSEIKQNRIAVDTSSHASIAGGFNSINMMIATDPGLAEIFTKGMADPKALSEIESMRFIMVGQSYVNQFAVINNLNDNRAIKLMHYEVLAVTFAHFMTSPGGEYIIDNVTVPPDLMVVINKYKSVPHTGWYSADT